MRKRNIIFFVLVSIFTTSNVVWAGQPWNGMDIVRFCTGDTVLFDESICRAYLQGVADTVRQIKKDPSTKDEICVPESKKDQNHGESLYPKWLATFKERWHKKPIVITLDALKAIFPCKIDP